MRSVQVEVTEGGQALVVVAADGRRRTLAADLLWTQCPSAAGRARRALGRSAAPKGLTITALREIGQYGVNIAFSDGHDRGIYPWSYLATLGVHLQPEDFLIP